MKVLLIYNIVFYVILTLCINVGEGYAQGELIALENQYNTLIKQKKLKQAAKLAFQLGNSYYKFGNTSEASVYFDKAADHYRELNLLKKAGQAYTSSGDIKFENGEFLIALSLYNRGLKVYRLSKDKKNYVLLLIKIGQSLIEVKRHKNAISALNRALVLSKELESEELVANSYNLLSLAHELEGDRTKALQYYKSYSNAIDEGSKSYISKIEKNISMIEKEKNHSIRELNSKKEELSKKDILLELRNQELINLETERRAIEAISRLQKLKIDSLDKEKKIKELEISQQKEHIANQQIIRNTSIGGASVFLLFLLILYRNYKIKREDNKLLASKNREISMQKTLLVDSIRYAGNIQHAILPTENKIMEFFPDSFVIYKPRDIVSGDFYWFADFDGFSIIVVADCTGHGVPGALLSMIGSTLLDEIIKDNKVYDPATILENLHIGIRNALKQDEKNNLESIELGICNIEHLSEEKIKILFAGAKRPLYIGTQKELIELKAERKAIGGRQREDHRTFTNKEAILSKGDTIWMSTDGYADQANMNLEKIGSRNLKELLNDIQILPAQEQKIYLLEKLNDHKSSQVQIDDIALVGIKF